MGRVRKEYGRGGKGQQKGAFGGKKEEKMKGVRKGRLLGPLQGVERYSGR